MSFHNKIVLFKFSQVICISLAPLYSFQIFIFLPIQLSLLFGNTTFEVIILKYPDLYAVLADVPQAKQYFEKLPDYVRDQISTRAEGVNSFESLKHYADNLLRGDD